MKTPNRHCGLSLKLSRSAWRALAVVLLGGWFCAERGAAQQAPPTARAAGAANRPVLGVRLREAPGGKVFVSEVSSGGAAERASIRAGDQLVSIGDAKIASVQDVAQAMEKQVGAKSLSIGIDRNGQSRQLKVQPLTPSAMRPRHRAMIGIQMADEPTGLTVLQTYAGGPAELGGVQPGDIITGVDGASVTNSNQLLQLLRRHQAGEKIDLLVTRNGWRRNFVLTLADRQQIARAKAEAAASAVAAQAQPAITTPDQTGPGFDSTDESNVNLRALDTDFD